MADFPEIGRYAVAQYLSSFELLWPATVQTAVDGSEQRFVRRARAMKTWNIRLDWLREDDADKVWKFFTEQGGRAGGFRFRDPWTNEWHEPCWFDTDDLAFVHLSEGVFQGNLVISTQEI